MAFSVISEQLKEHVQEELDRLRNSRSDIIESAIAHATQEIDQAIRSLTALLDDQNEPDREIEAGSIAPKQEKSRILNR